MRVKIRGKTFTVTSVRGKPYSLYSAGSQSQIAQCQEILTEKGMLDIQTEQVTDEQWCITAVYPAGECRLCQ